MDVNAWLMQLNKWGFKDALKRPKTTIAFYVAYVILRWLAIALALLVAVSIWFLFTLIASVLKGK